MANIPDKISAQTLVSPIGPLDDQPIGFTSHMPMGPLQDQPIGITSHMPMGPVQDQPIGRTSLLPARSLAQEVKRFRHKSMP
ncbi:unnamed protein product, partial [Allacma fusca]